MTDEQRQEAGQALAEYMAQAIEAAWAVIAEFIESVTDVCRKVYTWAQERYQEAGAPYGPSDDGMLRWWRELLEAARLRREADMILERHQFLAGLRTQRL